MGESKLDLLQGTLDLMVLQTLTAIGAQHGYGIARRIEQVSGDEVLLNQGTIYASLVRLQQRGWIAAWWKLALRYTGSVCSSASGSPPNGAPPTTIARPSSTPSPARAGSNSPKTQPTGNAYRT